MYIFVDTEFTIQQSDVDWLKENDEPQDEVIQKWKDTFTLRGRYKKVENYFASYKCLQSPYAFTLVNLNNFFIFMYFCIFIYCQ